MPFTFSHPALVLPLTYLPGKWFSLTGLIIGSIVPDFEYFVRMRLRSEFSHTIEGLFWFDLPLGILLAFIFHNLVRTSFIGNLPLFLKSRLFAFSRFNWNKYSTRNWLVVIISILIGAASHLLWDSFTHDSGFFVESLPILTSSVNVFGEDVRVLRILQHASSLMGGIVVIYAIYKLPVAQIPHSDVNWKYWVFFAALSILIVLVRIVSGLIPEQYGHLVVTIISAGLISLVLTPIVIRPKKSHL